MDQLFAAQPAAFPDLEAAMASPGTTQSQMSMAQPLDQKHQQASQDSRHTQSMKRLVNGVFGKDQLDMVKFPTATQISIDVNATGFTQFEKGIDYNMDPLKNMASAYEKGFFGQQEAFNTIRLTKAAFAAAAKANPLQMLKNGIGPSFKAGIYNNAFNGNQETPIADVFLRRISRFVQPDNMKEMLWNYSAANGVGQFEDESVHVTTALGKQPDENLSVLAALQSDPMARQQILRTGIAGKIRQQQLGPNYARAPTITPLERARKVAKQFTLGGNYQFKIKPANRFVV